MEIIFKEFLISDNKEKIDQNVVVDYLARSYWADKRPVEKVLKSIEASKCYGVYLQDKQVGFARVITDGATFYYLCDVFVLEEFQGQGIGKKLVEVIVNSEEYEWMTGLLGTRDAHGLYEKYGFERDAERVLRRVPQSRSGSLRV
ncbi:GNAT family N-acetyltransferase [Paenibacillus sp. P96]|uniref:GNAT family N-acetyltransferase n=1 Tax=Paenibacillus zeirhizosphaerae TaxID=2987519 RepID=A0ABT9FLZ4_9BACL|nr:GNAT family N-acetyltransferase [Paenibacillus sp. P96]MDP4095561.1 GNAT family N-acetyltransferase [Paenibacillus sp. P96]